MGRQTFPVYSPRVFNEVTTFHGVNWNSFRCTEDSYETWLAEFIRAEPQNTAGALSSAGLMHLCTMLQKVVEKLSNVELHLRMQVLNPRC